MKGIKMDDQLWWYIAVSNFDQILKFITKNKVDIEIFYSVTLITTTSSISVIWGLLLAFVVNVHLLHSWLKPTFAFKYFWSPLYDHHKLLSYYNFLATDTGNLCNNYLGMSVLTRPNVHDNFLLLLNKWVFELIE